ncbi:MAG: hypothetical protein K2M94_01895 [Paramuribaculum sp.]|nr:hypothetical protein [Paramuribaculum sp.]
MILRTLITGFVLLNLSLLISCSQISREEIETSLREAEMSVATGDMEVATSVGNHLLGEDNARHLSATDLARLSIMYMQMADSGNADDNTALAAELYRRALSVSADSTDAYLQSLPTDKMQYADMLQAISSNIDNPNVDIEDYHLEYDSIPADTLTESKTNK